MFTVNDLMTTNPITILPELPLPEAADLMTAENCRHLPVVDEEGQLIGILTDRDVRQARHTAVFPTALAESCMTPNPITVTPETAAQHAAELLGLHKISALPVVDQGQLVGIITVSDFLTQFAATEVSANQVQSAANKELFQAQYSGWDLVKG
ncbi:MAG: CBS domain-containing protein [Chloroflexi bacterium]|nr:CBS domain-containing protein [Chloroflexota bacterium]